MKLIEHENKGITLIPVTATDEYFLLFLKDAITAKEKEIERQIALIRQSVAQVHPS